MKINEFKIRHHNREIWAKSYLPDTNQFSVVIISHGFNGSGSYFEHHAAEIAKSGFGAVVFDFCGGGVNAKSSLRTEEMTIFTEKEDLYAVLDTVQSWKETKNIFLFGESMGGFVTALASNDRADKIKAIALLYPAFCIPDDWSTRYPNISDIPKAYDIWSVPIGYEFIKTLHGFNPYDHLGAFDKNVLIMHGDSDTVVPLSYSERAVEIYEKARLEIFKDEGHGFSGSSTNIMLDMLIDFIRQNEEH